MPVRKFRRVEDMTPPPFRVPGGLALQRSIAFVLNTAAHMSPLRFPAGVHKHRSVEEMDAQQNAWRRRDAAASEAE